MLQAACPAAVADGSNSLPDVGTSSHKQLDVRKFSPVLDGKWIGEGISYSPYREGQTPEGPNPIFPTVEQLTEDLELIAQRWHLIRLYGARRDSEDALRIIHDRQLPVRVMLGAWLSPEHDSESRSAEIAKANIEANRREVAGAIRLANAYPTEVIAVNVGNETQVFWSQHRCHPEVLIRYIREVRAAISQPVTTADDFNFWNKPESQTIAREVDFIVTHIYAMWGGVKLSDAMPWTKRIYGEVCEAHPNMTVVLGEAGWATQVHTEGEQAKMIKGKAGEKEQRMFYLKFTDWARERKICTFFFEAFDEPWKGGSHPNEVEKHWGLYRVDRTPKPALIGSDGRP
jgi:exo-beta-1,3-glucanase (GH17 family)